MNLKLELIALSAIVASTASAGTIIGNVTDSITGEPLIGVTIITKGKSYGTVTDIDGNYKLTVPDGTYDIVAHYTGYKNITFTDTKIKGPDKTINFRLPPDNKMLGEVTVTARARFDTDLSQIREQKHSFLVQSGVSAQQISRTQDKDASEVIKRVPGISIIDDKFIMVRGLSQRYNNVWLNGSAVPSSEADSRSFSFDILPSSQLDNIVIVKSPAPEYPADFTGGFVLVNTKQQPENDRFDISLGLGMNTTTHFRKFLEAKGGKTDFLGFDNGFRSLTAGMDKALKTYPGTNKIDPLANGLNNDWTVKNNHPIGDIKLNMSYNHLWKNDEGRAIGLIGAINYSNTYKTYTNMENSLYGPYDTTNDKPVFLRKATDNQYNNDVRLGALLNLSLQPSNSNHLYEWKNIFNQLGKERYSTRSGFNAQPDNINDDEYFYSSRTTYNTQFTGRHDFNGHKVNWNVGYAYANRNMPDRRLIERTDRTDQKMGIYRISREFSKLDEHIASIGANYEKEMKADRISPKFKAGIYGEYRTRNYRTRQFQYGWEPKNNLPEDWIFNENVTEDILVDTNYGPDKLYMYEEINYLNNYKGRQQQAAAYFGVNLPFNQLSIYAGVRYEYCRQTLSMNTKQFEESLKDTHYDYNDLFPSINATYKISDAHQLRAAYGRSTNRPEFRELSSSVFYDFDLGSNVMGNYDLKAAYIDNVDLRYEWYPSSGEQISVALFYKHFKNPIEWTYTVSGGTDLIYSFINAKGANNYGIEIDIKKNLDFIGLKDFSLSFNGALIKSKVNFKKGTNDIDRPMQGQSPYLINTGLFYNNKKKGWSAAILYNRIGKRIIGVGNRYGTASDGTSRNIPNSYEMPRNSLDLSLGKTFGQWEIKASAKDLLTEKFVFKQFETVTINGVEKEISETTKNYKPGVNLNISVKYTF